MENLRKIISVIEREHNDKIPESVVYILNESGFNSRHALKKITDENIGLIEQYFNDNFDKLIGGLVDYPRDRPFKLLPGHRAIIQSFPEVMDQLAVEKKTAHTSNDFSFVLKWLIETAEKNAGRVPKGRRFSENIQLFATYLYLMCGRACYETLSANLPIPQANTIRTFECYLFLFT